MEFKDLDIGKEFRIGNGSFIKVSDFDTEYGTFNAIGYTLSFEYIGADTTVKEGI